MSDPVLEMLAPVARRLEMSTGGLANVLWEKFLAAGNGRQPTPHQMRQFAALCVETHLNPATSEVTPLIQGNRVSLIIGIDGWIKIARLQPDYSHYRLEFSEQMIDTAYHRRVPVWVKSMIYLKSQEDPLEWYTFYDEFFVESNPNWKSRPMQMLQIRALANGIKRAFGLSILDRDEALAIQSAEQTAEAAKTTAPTSQILDKIRANRERAQLVAPAAPQTFETPAEAPEAAPAEPKRGRRKKDEVAEVVPEQEPAQDSAVEAAPAPVDPDVPF